MSPDDVLARLRQVITSASPEITPEDIRPASSFRTDLGLDSLSTIDLLVDVERDFGVSIPDNAIPSLTTIADLTDFLLSARRAANEERGR